MSEDYFTQIEKVEKIASASKFQRMLRSPFKYIDAILYREMIYKRTKKEKEVVCETFFNSTMHLLLPSGTDIYLTGGKSHDSEIRLAKFLIKNLKPNDTFVDVGAHYGYFTLLASKLVGNSGQVIAFEASFTTYGILEKNTSSIGNVKSYNFAVSDKNADLKFYEFPNLYSEYNTMNIDQFKNEDWFSEYHPKEVTIKGITLDDFLFTEKTDPKIIKIDVEGAEFKVINGLKRFLMYSSPIVVMEFLANNRGNKEHIKAVNLLQSCGYNSYIIEKNGEPTEVKAIPDYIQNKGLESDNIAFMKNEIAS